MNFQLADAVAVLGRTPGVLHTLLGNLPEPWITNNYGPQTFSPFDVVGHLIHGERTDWMPRVRLILEHGPAKPFQPFDRYAMIEQNKGKSIGELLETFSTLRMENIAQLAALNLGPRELALRGKHPALGDVTMENLLATWVAHDLNHIHQVAKCMAWQYRDAVGPWREYLTILPKA
ncbi:MAG: DinB family protein [Phycisphaerae bacterium]